MLKLTHTPPPTNRACRHDKQLVSHDVHTSNYNYKYTFSVEVAPLCKVGEAGWGWAAAGRAGWEVGKAGLVARWEKVAGRCALRKPRAR